VKQPTIFVNRDAGRLLGSDSFDAYVFWPRVKLSDGREDWMAQTLGRKPKQIPRQLLKGQGMRLVQAFIKGEPASAIPVDQVILATPNDRIALMLPPGRFWLRIIDRNSNVIAQANLSIR